MGIGTTKAKAINAYAPWGAFRYGRPFPGLLCNIQVSIKWLDSWIELVEVQIGRDYAMLQRQRALDDAGDTSSTLRMTNDGFDGANVEW
jgi:hypothetical protein